VAAQPSRWAWAEVDLDALARNVSHLRQLSQPAAVWAVVKANAYGHGAVEVARAAVAAGAQGLCVALVTEAVQLRKAGLEVPILLLSEQPVEAIPLIVEHDLSPTVYNERWIRALVAAGANQIGVHLKVDTGMQRVGAAPHAVPGLVELILGSSPAIHLAGVCTHLATADDPQDPAAQWQLDQFDAVLVELAQIPDLEMSCVQIHAANSAGALAHPRARGDLVRPGIALYGISPGQGVDALCSVLEPVMRLCARVSHVKRVERGSRISYGLRHQFDRDTTVATVPLGYADGVPRRLASVGGQVLVGGRRRAIVGMITMDQLMVDMGDDPVAIGDAVVLLGTQGGEQIRAEEWALALDTIGYEIVCGISSRVERVIRRTIED
jgi:alanine racemase